MDMIMVAVMERAHVFVLLFAWVPFFCRGAEKEDRRLDHYGQV